MPFRNIEIKAKSSAHKEIREWLGSNNAEFKGTDHQVDTYFHVPNGRLKIREGNIEKSLIQYNRDDQAAPKLSDVSLIQLLKTAEMKKALTRALGIKVVVDKCREIYFIDNVKFHLDQVENLGEFVEIEVIDEHNNLSLDDLEKQCNYYVGVFGITQSDLVHCSYSDLILSKQNT